MAVATSILAAMSKNTRPEDILIYRDRVPVAIPGIEYSSYKRSFGYIASLIRIPLSGKYGLINHCQNFAAKLLCQLITPTKANLKEICRWLKNLPEVLQASLAESMKEVADIRRVHPTVGRFLGSLPIGF